MLMPLLMCALLAKPLVMQNCKFCKRCLQKQAQPCFCKITEFRKRNAYAKPSIRFSLSELPLRSHISSILPSSQVHFTYCYTKKLYLCILFCFKQKCLLPSSIDIVLRYSFLPGSLFCLLYLRTFEKGEGKQ